jgi:hypothetical protein
MKSLFICLTVIILGAQVNAQDVFNFELELSPVSLTGFPGLHSFAFAQHDEKWLLIGGRKDGLHARQPFASFLKEYNNTEIYVIDIAAGSVWTSSVNSLPLGIKEQLQSTNMNFYQDADTLYIIGGYAHSASLDKHVTFSDLTSVNVPGLINAIMNGNPVSEFFKQISDPIFAVSGGQLGKIGNTFYLVGGHRFDGLYNPMNNPTFTQTYTNQIRKFEINNSGDQLSFHNYQAITDELHLHRRDYNLLPQVFPDGSMGYTISSGVFQVNVDLPFLYPVDIKAEGHNAITSFNQYLSHYHGAKAAMYDEQTNQMHTLFFGGMSQYYYNGELRIQDDNVPFVKTISRLTRYADGSLQEYLLSSEMPGFKGASSEFIPNNNLPHYPSKIVKLSEISDNKILIGHIVGGILSPTLNPFTNNATATTTADNSVYAVHLVRMTPTSSSKINGVNPYTFVLHPDPLNKTLGIRYNSPPAGKVYYYISAADGKIIQQGKLREQSSSENEDSISLENPMASQHLIITLVFDDVYFSSASWVNQN